MIEPLQLGAPVLIGPHTGNFEPLATELCKAGALLRVTDSANIASAVHSLLQDSQKRRAMIVATSHVLEAHQGATLRNCELLEALLIPRIY